MKLNKTEAKLVAKAKRLDLYGRVTAETGIDRGVNGTAKGKSFGSREYGAASSLIRKGLATEVARSGEFGSNYTLTIRINELDKACK